jgi:hypothetical protein
MLVYLYTFKNFYAHIRAKYDYILLRRYTPNIRLHTCAPIYPYLFTSFNSHIRSNHVYIPLRTYILRYLYTSAPQYLYMFKFFYIDAQYMCTCIYNHLSILVCKLQHPYNYIRLPTFTLIYLHIITYFDAHIFL